MSDPVRSVYDWQQIEIFARQILGKKAFRGVCPFWQENPVHHPSLDTRQPVRLYIVNDGASPGTSPPAGSPVKCVKLCKRAVLPGYPKYTLMGSRKSRIICRFYLVLLIEYENGEFKVITLPRQLSAPGSFRRNSVMAFSEMISRETGSPVPQYRNEAGITEKLTIVSGDKNPMAFEYMLTFPMDAFEPGINPIDLENPSLQSVILLSNLRYESDAVEPYLALAGDGSTIWTTAVDFILYEDIAIKLGIDQDIVVQGLPE